MTQGPPRSILPRRVGIHGVRGAGKTCYLGSLYGFRAGGSVILDFADDATCHYLATVWKDLSEARVPGATLLAIPTTLHMDLSTSDDLPATPLQLCDYAGLLVEPKAEGASPAAHTLAAGVREWLRSCHAVLVFLDSSRPDLDQVDAIDLLLTEMRRPSADGPILERPVAVVLTKWDSQGVVGDDLEKEQARARELLKSHHAFRQIGRKLDAAQVKVFPVSSFGNHARGPNPPELARYHPCHLHAPLAWAAQVSDLVLFEEAREVASRHLGRGLHVLGVNVWPQPDLAAAKQVWSSLRRDATPGSGPLAEKIDHEMEALGSRRRQGWLGYLAATAALLALLVLGLNQAARAADSQADEVVAICGRLDGPEHAPERLARAEAFLSSWGSRLVPHRRAEVAELRSSAAAVLAEQAERPSVVERFTELEAAGKWEEACSVVEDLATRYPSSPIRSDLGQRWLRAADERGRAQARERAAQLEKEGELEAALAACQQYLASHEASPNRGEIEARARSLRQAIEDRDEYEQLRRFALRREPASLEEAARLARAYIEARKPERSMRREAERFWLWFEALRKGGEFEVLLESIEVPPGSDLTPGWGGVRTRAHLSINGKSSSTGSIHGANATPGVKLGPFPFRWGEPGRMTLVVEGFLNLRGPAAVRAERDDPLFILGQASGPVAMRCKKGKEVRVVLSCPAAEPPSLPPYRRR
jgi:hypothetical protein